MTDDAMRTLDAERAALAVVLRAEEIEEASLEEVERRRSEVADGRAQLVPWADVRREMFEMIEQAHLSESQRER